MKTVWSGVALGLLALALPARADKPADGPDRKPEPKKIQVPYRLSLPKHIIVRAKINGKGPYNFLLDTGAPALFVSPKVAEKLDIKPDRKHWAKFNRLEIEGGAVVTGLTGRVEDVPQLKAMNRLGLAGIEIHGILGYDVLARFRMEIDFTRDKMAWTKLDYEPKAPMGLGKAGGGNPMGSIELMGQLMEGLGGFLGLRAEPPVAMRGFYGMELADSDDGPVVRSVLAKGPAAEGGLEVGDRITEFQGRTVTDTGDVRRFARRQKPGATVKLTVHRGKETKEITVKTEEGL